MLKPRRRYIWFSLRLKSEHFSTIISMKFPLFGYFQKAPIVIGLYFGGAMSRTRFSTCLWCRDLVGKHRCYLISKETPQQFLFLSHWRISCLGRLSSELGTVWSSFDSVIPVVATLVLLTIILFHLFFELKLFMFICKKNVNLFF